MDGLELRGEIVIYVNFRDFIRLGEGWMRERAYFGMKTLKSKKWRWDTELKMSISSSMLLDVYEVYPRYKKERNNKRIIVGE